MSPYYGKTFFSFFAAAGQRLFLFLTGQLGWNDLAPDETQILVLAMVAVSGACTGVFLLLRKATMLANSLSHTILLGIVLAFVLLLPWKGEWEGHSIPLAALLIASFVTAMVTTVITEFLIKGLRLPPDASIGLVFTTLFALGIVLVTLLTRNAHIGTEAIMGNVDALHKNDILFTFAVAAANLFLVLLFFKEYTLTTFDGAYARSLGLSSAFFSMLLMAQVSFTIVAGFRAVGVLMILAFVTAPPLTGRLLVNRMRPLLALSIVFGIVPSVLGVVLARHLYSVWDLPVSTGGLVVTLLGIQYFFYLFMIHFRNRRLRPAFDRSSLDI